MNKTKKKEKRVTEKGGTRVCSRRHEPDIDGEVAADRADGRLGGIGLTEKLTTSKNHTLTLPDHADNGARRQELGQATEERLGREVRIVGLGILQGGGLELEGNELEALILEALNDL